MYYLSMLIFFVFKQDEFPVLDAFLGGGGLESLLMKCPKTFVNNEMLTHA